MRKFHHEHLWSEGIIPKFISVLSAAVAAAVSIAQALTPNVLQSQSGTKILQKSNYYLVNW